MSASARVVTLLFSAASTFCVGCAGCAFGATDAGTDSGQQFDAGPRDVFLNEAPYCGETTQGLWEEWNGRRIIYGHCELRSDQDVEDFNAANIKEVGGALSFRGPDALASTKLSVQNVEQIGQFEVGGSRSALTTISIPNLTLMTGGIGIWNNDLLAQLDFPVLARIEGAVNIRSNDILPLCQIEALLDRITILGDVSIGFNCEDCPCSP